MKNKISKLICTWALLFSLQQTAIAGFPIGLGRCLFVPTYTRYQATAYWDKQGLLTNYANNGKYLSSYLGLYGGFGVDRDLDVIFNVNYLSQHYLENGIDAETPLQSTGDFTLGLCYYLNHYDYFKHLSVTGSLIFPTYPAIENTTLLPGYASTGAEIKLGLCGTNTKTLKNTYYDLEAGIRSYFNAGGPTQFFANATLGVPIGEDWKLSGTLNLISSSSGLSNDAIPKTIFVNRDFDYLRGTISLGRRVDRNIWLYGSIFRDFSGSSVGQGHGFSIYAVIKL